MQTSNAIQPRRTGKITLATVKAFIRKHREDLLINVTSRFDGQVDGCMPENGGFIKAELTNEHFEYSLGVKGAWFVGQSRDYFKPYDNFGGDMTGIEVTNCCGRFILAIKK